MDDYTRFLSNRGKDCHYGQLREELVGYAKKLGMGEHDAEDKVHSVLVKAWDTWGVRGAIELSLPYLKVMLKNLWLDGKRITKKEENWEESSLHAEPSEDEEGKEELAALEQALKKHKYGYIVLQMEERRLRSIKELAPYVNQKKEKLYKRYQKLLKDLKREFSPERG